VSACLCVKPQMLIDSGNFILDRITEMHAAGYVSTGIFIFLLSFKFEWESLFHHYILLHYRKSVALFQPREDGI